MPKKPDDVARSLIRSIYESGDKNPAYEKIVEYMPLIRKIASKYVSTSSSDWDDFIMAGVAGILKAINSFTPTKAKHSPEDSLNLWICDRIEWNMHKYFLDAILITKPEILVRASITINKMISILRRMNMDESDIKTTVTSWETPDLGNTQEAIKAQTVISKLKDRILKIAIQTAAMKGESKNIYKEYVESNDLATQIQIRNYQDVMEIETSGNIETPEDVLFEKERMLEIRTLFGSKFTDILRMRTDGHTYQEIADKYGVSKQSIGQLISRLIKKYQSIKEEEGLSIYE
jgi:RNA polymerase sigma factor (sigma-70 family)